MASFTEEEASENRLDWDILSSGGIALYRRREILAEDLARLSSSGYQSVSFDTARWLSEAAMHEALEHDLAFPNYYGRNLDALHECIREDLKVPDVGGLVLVLMNYDRFDQSTAVADPDGKSTAHILLDILAGAIRFHMLYGRRLIVLLQSDDPRLNFTNLGRVTGIWNQREWLFRDRGL